MTALPAVLFISDNGDHMSLNIWGLSYLIKVHTA